MSEDLYSLGVTAQEYGSLLIPIIMSQLPNEIRLEIARKSTANVLKIEELLETIRIQIEAREVSEAIKAQEVQGRKHNHDLGKFPPTANALVSMQGKDFQLRCVYCSREHHSASFTKVRNANCDGKHHPSICLELNTNSPRDKNRPPSSTSGEQNEKDTENNGVTATTNSENTNSKHRFLLQTATAIATNDEGTKSTKIRECSLRSYITDSLRSKLRLKSLQMEKLNLNPFGSSKFKRQSCEVVNLGLHKSEHNDPITISALAFPVICCPLHAKVYTNYAHLDGLELADELCS